MTIKYTEWPFKRQNGKNCIPNDHKKYQHLPSQDHPKFTQIGIFGFKINHLATLF
jgi:hypothetical protein